MHHLVVVGDDFGAGGEFVEPGVPAVGVDPIAAEWARVDPVERRRLMQADERIGVVPVTAGSARPVDDHDGRVGFVEDHVGEGHPHGAGADDQIVGFEHPWTVGEIGPCRPAAALGRRSAMGRSVAAVTLGIAGGA